MTLVCDISFDYGNWLRDWLSIHDNLTKTNPLGFVMKTEFQGRC